MRKQKSPRQQAASRGDVTYEGTECSRCGSTTRYVLCRNCVACVKSRSKKAYQQMRDAVLRSRQGDA